MKRKQTPEEWFGNKFRNMERKLNSGRLIQNFDVLHFQNAQNFI